MRLKISILAVLFFALAAGASFGAHTEISNVAADAAQGIHDVHEAAHAEESHGLPPAAVPLFHVGAFQVTNSMLVVWIVAAGLILVAQLATRDIKMVPSGLQNFVEWLVESLLGFFENILGEKLARKSFWFFCTIFIFILFTNWFGLFPGIGTVGWGHEGEHGFHLTEPIFRGASADLNLTAAMALLFFLMWTIWSVQEIGAGGVIGHIFMVKGHGKGFFAMFLVFVFICVGLIEIVSISIRPVALMFRLYGNIFAGENILETMMHLGGPFFGWLLVLPFYLLELLVGLVQALVFALLTSVFTALMCGGHHDDEHGHGEEAAAH